LRPCSQARCSFVVNPAPERPNPWSAGSGGPVPPGGSTCRSPFACPGGVLVGAGNGGVDADVPADQPGRISAGLEPGQDPGLGAVALPAAKQPVDGLPPPVAGGHISPGRTATRVRHRIPSMSCRLVHIGGRPGLVPVGSSGASIAHWVSVRSCRPVTGMVITRSPEGWSSSSKYQLPETSLRFGQPDITTRSTAASGGF